MKKYLLFAAIALVAAGCNQQSQQQQTPPPASTTQVYSNGTYGFTFQYPQDLSFVTPNYATLQDKIVELSIPHDAYPKTNFGDAAFSVSASYEKTLADCLKASPPENSDGFKTQTTINGTTYYMTKGSGAGAGNRYNTTAYRTFKGTQTCIEINETIHTASIGNFTPGSVTEVDSAAIQTRLDNILNTFKFN